jgi:hypothetical protein
MIVYRGFHPSLRVGGVDFDIRRPKVVMVEDDRIALEAKIKSGPWEGEQLRIDYSGDIGIEEGRLVGSIERVVASSGGEPLFEVVFDEAMELTELLKNGWRHARGDDDHDRAEDEEDEEDEDEEDKDEEDEDEEDDHEDEDDKEDEEDDTDDEEDQGGSDDDDHHDGSWSHDDRDLEVLLDVKKLLRLIGDEGFESRGGRAGDKLRGGEGDDVLHGHRGRDKLFGSDGGDDLDGGEGRDSIRGGNGDDEIHGGGGRDKLYGGSGDDWIVGGRGRDFVEGGTGADTFVFSDLDDLGLKKDRDIVKRFESGQDVLDLAGIDADRTSDGDQTFEYIGAGRFTGEAGELRYERGMLMGDVDGDREGDFHIRCKGAVVGGDDFVL